MATYSYRCAECGTIDDRTFPIGTALRITKCDCGGKMRLRIGVGVGISANALETKGRAVRAVDLKENQWQKDMPAYKRMRHRGLYPDQIDGSAQLEDRVDDQHDIKYEKLNKRLIGKHGVTEKNVKSRVIEAEQVAQDLKLGMT